ncbi:hypothetical protein FWD20_02420 [Candidatus Saccharibacteria bacterium]|nr:hypothetical protein [Candidatus Saccharibacteria bacterium]
MGYARETVRRGHVGKGPDKMLSWGEFCAQQDGAGGGRRPKEQIAAVGQVAGTLAPAEQKPEVTIARMEEAVESRYGSDYNYVGGAIAYLKNTTRVWGDEQLSQRFYEAKLRRWYDYEDQL